MIMHYISIEAPQAEQMHNTTKIGYKKTHLMVISSFFVFVFVFSPPAKLTFDKSVMGRKDTV